MDNSLSLEIFTIFFWLSILLISSSYFIYPVLIWIIGKTFHFYPKKNDFLPGVSIIIAAYNEEKNIERKIINTLKLDYPPDKMEILIGSDGSTDNTAEIVRRFAGGRLRFFNFSENRGKTSVQNDLVEQSSNNILIFTDAASFLPENALKKLVRNFADIRVGCVAGRLVFVMQGLNITTQSQGIYWRYEVKIREMESRIGRLIGVDGPLYAVKKEFYIALRPNIISDLMTPLLVLEQGKKVILEPEALVEEEPTLRGQQEFNTRRRIVLRGMVGIFSHPEVINPFRHPVLSLQVFFHKIIRWFVGLLVIINTGACVGMLFCGSSMARAVLPVYVFFFASAALGWWCDRMSKKVKLLTVPYYFCLVNWAATCGIIDFLRKKQAATWQTVR